MNDSSDDEEILVSRRRGRGVQRIIDSDDENQENAYDADNDETELTTYFGKKKLFLLVIHT